MVFDSKRKHQGNRQEGIRNLRRSNIPNKEAMRGRMDTDHPLRAASNIQSLFQTQRWKP